MEDETSEIKRRFIGYVKNALERFEPKDIVILCRTNGEASSAGMWLMEQGFSVESAQTLNIRNNNVIKQIMSLLMFIVSPIDKLSFASFLIGEVFLKNSKVSKNEIEDFLFAENGSIKKTEVFYKKFQDKYEDIWTKYFEEFFLKAGFVPVYELVLSILEKFEVIENFKENKAFIMRFLEVVKNFEHDDSGLKKFINYFNDLRPDDEALYVKSISGVGIKVMTIHKSKGLQFPVVILPFLKLSENRSENPFFDDSGEKINLMYLSKDAASFSGKLKEIYNKERGRNLLSELNVMYVSMTRAECELYAIVPTKAGASNNSAAVIFGNADIAEGVKNKYIINSDDLSVGIKDSVALGYRDILKNLTNGNTLNLDSNEAKKRGTMLHFALSRIISLKESSYTQEIERVLEITKRKFLYDETMWIEGALSSLFKSGKILELFNYDESEIFNEKEIVDSSGRTLRIDKLINSTNKVIVADFKSSNHSHESNKKQVLNYMNAISEIYPDKKIEGYIVDIEKKEMVEI